METIRAILKKELDLPIVEIGDESAKLDGGDVLFTGTALARLIQEAKVVTFFCEWIVARFCMRNSIKMKASHNTL